MPETIVAAVADAGQLASPEPVAAPIPSGAVQGASDTPTATAEAARGSFRDVFSVPRPSETDQLGERVLDRLDRIQRRTMAPDTAEATGRVAHADGATGPAAVGDAGSAQFDRQMQLLEKSFHHAIEVELCSKTSTSLASSMNKLMSGN